MAAIVRQANGKMSQPRETTKNENADIENTLTKIIVHAFTVWLCHEKSVSKLDCIPPPRRYPVCKNANRSHSGTSLESYIMLFIFITFFVYIYIVMKIDTFVDSSFDYLHIPQELQVFLTDARLKRSISTETLAQLLCK